MVARDDGATDLSGGDFGHVQDDDRRDEANTKAGNETADNELRVVSTVLGRGKGGKTYEGETVRGGLEDTSDNEDTATDDDGDTSTDPLGDVTSDYGTEEGTGREDRGDGRLLAGGKGKGCLLGVGGVGARNGDTGNEVDKV